MTLKLTISDVGNRVYIISYHQRLSAFLFCLHSRIARFPVVSLFTLVILCREIPDWRSCLRSTCNKMINSLFFLGGRNWQGTVFIWNLKNKEYACGKSRTYVFFCHEETYSSVPTALLYEKLISEKSKQYLYTWLFRYYTNFYDTIISSIRWKSSCYRESGFPTTKRARSSNLSEVYGLFLFSNHTVTRYRIGNDQNDFR